MIARETIEINGKNYTHIYSTESAPVRCGAKRYFDAVDPIGIEKAYFEEGIENAEGEQ